MNKFHNAAKSHNPMDNSSYPQERGAYLGNVYVNRLVAAIRKILNENPDKIGIRKISEYLDEVNKGAIPQDMDTGSMLTYKHNKQFVEALLSRFTINTVISQYRGNENEIGNYIEPIEIQRMVNSLARLLMTLGVSTNDMSKIHHVFKNSLKSVALDGDNLRRNNAILFTMDRLKITMGVMQCSDELAGGDKEKASSQKIKGLVTRVSDTIVSHIDSKLTSDKIIKYLNKFAKGVEANDDTYDDKYDFVRSVLECPAIDKAFDNEDDDTKTRLASSINGLFEKFGITNDELDDFLQEIEVLNKDEPSAANAALLATFKTFVEKVKGLAA